MDTNLRIARKEAEYLLADPNIVGVGIGWDGIVVSIIDWKDFEPVPARIYDVPVSVVKTGPIVALQDRTARWRPAPGGVSVGHKEVTAGTLSCLVIKDDEWFILSNNHVLANMNNAEIGDEILQPGVYDNGLIPDDVIATLEDFVPVEFLLDLGECPIAAGITRGFNALAKVFGAKHRMNAIRLNNGVNVVDAAIARPINPNDVTWEVLGIETPIGHREVELGSPVVKSGRTTEVTRGQVTQIDATLQVLYGNNVAVFEQQIVTDALCGGGDSGSIVLADDGSGDAVGLLFAGSQDGKTMIMNPIRPVLDLLGVSFG